MHVQVYIAYVTTNICLHACVCERYTIFAHTHIYIYICIHIYAHTYIYIYRYPRLFILIGAPSLNPGVVSPDARVVINNCASGYAAWPCLAWERWR